MLISRYLAKFDWLSQVKAYRQTYAERRDAMLGALQTHMPEGTTWTNPDGGFYVWVTLPEGFDAAAMLPRAVTARVAYVPGTAFYADGLGSRQLRLSYCFPTSERIVEGIRRLATVLDSELDVMRTFGTTVGRAPRSVRRRRRRTPPDRYARAARTRTHRRSRPQHNPDLPRRMSR